MRRLRTVLGVATLAGLVAYLATGFEVVGPGEAVVVRRLGRLLPRPWTPGLRWGWPLGLERRDRVRTDEVRRLEVGLAGIPGRDDEPGAGEFLTGDKNFLRVRAVVQYRVADPVAFVLHSGRADELLARLAEASLCRALSARGIDDVLHEGRAALARDAGGSLSESASRLGLGVAVLGVSLTDARPPAEVQAAFDDAQSARSERDRRRNDARAYAEAVRPATLAESQARTDAARAEAARETLMARAEADRFLALLDEARRDRALTVRRIYRDALRELLPRVRRTLVLAPGEDLDLSLFERAP